MNVLGMLDALLLSVVLISSFEVVRILNPMDSPWKATGFVLITIGSFGWLNYDMAGHPVAWYALMLHSGLAVCSIIVMHNLHMRRRGTDRIISAKTMRILAKHR